MSFILSSQSTRKITLSHVPAVSSDNVLTNNTVEVIVIDCSRGFSRYISTQVLLIYQLNPEGAVINWLLACLHMHFNVVLCQWYVHL